MKWYRLAGAMLCVALLGACASKGPVTATHDPYARQKWQARLDRLAPVEAWDIKGRLAVRTEEDGGSATLLWQRMGLDHEIELYGPFGGGRVSIVQDASGAVMRDNKKNVFEDTSAAALLYRRVGWHVPFDSLKYWLKGVPEPGEVNALILDSAGLALGFQQRGWDIAILDYAEQGGFVLPRKLFIRALPGTVHLVDEKGRDLGDKLEVKVVLKRWLVEDL